MMAAFISDVYNTKHFLFNCPVYLFFVIEYVNLI